MKLYLLCITALASASALALKCEPKNIGEGRLYLENISGGVSGKQVIYEYDGGRAPNVIVKNLFVGVVLKDNGAETLYELYGKRGKKHTLKLEKEIYPPGGSCRYRYCPGPSNYENANAELILETGKTVSYNCINYI